MKVDPRFWASKTELLGHVSSASRAVVIEPPAERASTFCSFEIELPREKVGIAVMSAIRGTRPECWWNMAGKWALIGHDTFLTLLNLEGENLPQLVYLVGSFGSFVEDSNRDQMLVFHELGVLAVSKDTRINWRFDTKDIVTNWNCDDSKLRLQFMDSPFKTINLTDGTCTT